MCRSPPVTVSLLAPLARAPQALAPLPGCLRFPACPAFPTYPRWSRASCLAPAQEAIAAPAPTPVSRSRALAGRHRKPLPAVTPARAPAVPASSLAKLDDLRALCLNVMKPGDLAGVIVGRPGQGGDGEVPQICGE